jgi:hypothetical protein
MITASLSGADDLALALTCTYFFRLLSSTVNEHLRKFHGHLAGDRLLCVSAFNHGVPSFMQHEEIEDLIAYLVEHAISLDGWSVDDTAVRMNPLYLIRNLPQEHNKVNTRQGAETASLVRERVAWADIDTASKEQSPCRQSHGATEIRCSDDTSSSGCSETYHQTVCSR